MQIYRGLKLGVNLFLPAVCLRAVQIYRGLKLRAVAVGTVNSLRAVQIYRGLKLQGGGSSPVVEFESSADL